MGLFHKKLTAARSALDDQNMVLARTILDEHHKRHFSTAEHDCIRLKTFIEHYETQLRLAKTAHDEKEMLKSVDACIHTLAQIKEMMKKLRKECIKLD